MIRRVQAVGYWFNDQAPSGLPRAQRLIGTWDASRATVLDYLRSGRVFASYRGYSFCRFSCGIASRQMGHRDLSDGVFVWPEGLAHYLEVHQVRLPEPFVAHALSGSACPPRKIDVTRHRIDETHWLAWGREQGATVELTGWEPLSWEDQRKVLAQLARELGPGHALFGQDLQVLVGRRATGDLVCRLAAGQLATIRLTWRATPPDDPALPATKIVTNWDQWAG
jgi:hypothetical protein